MSTSRDSRWIVWLRRCSKDPHCPAYPLPPLGMLTGQDYRALAAVAMCWELYFGSDADGQRAALEAIRSLLAGMQQKCWPFARELVAFAGDWGDRDRLWPRVVGPQRELVS